VMTTVNKVTTGGVFLHVNGDVGTVVSMRAEGVVHVRMPNGAVIPVEYHERQILQDVREVTRRIEPCREYPEGDYIKVLQGTEIGSVRFMPLMLAWGITIHKAQGMTLKAGAQVVIQAARGKSIGNAAMIYVAASRCERGRDLIFVGTPQDLISSCNADFDVHQAGYLNLQK
jgi:ATP-dependent exoDNAse (exonuclease V) alpha subunit